MTELVRVEAKRLLRSAGVSTSDCQLVHVPDCGPGWIELRSATGARRLAVVALDLQGWPVAVLREGS